MEKNSYARPPPQTYRQIPIKKHRAFSGRRRTRRNKAKQFGLVNCNNFIIHIINNKNNDKF